MNNRYIPQSSKKAIDYFRSTKYNLDSAQTIYAVFFGINSDKVKNTPLFCGNGGLCGAVYAAVDIRPDLEDIICQEFQLKAKECTCDDIRNYAILPCHQCVQLACQILDDFQVPYVVESEQLWWEADPVGIEKKFRED